VNEKHICRKLVAPQSEGFLRDDGEGFPFSQELIDRFSNEAFLGKLPDPDGYASVRGECGDLMQVFLSIRDRRIRKARFDTLGCRFTIACGSMAMEMVEGRTVPEALRISSTRITEGLGGLPSSHMHCAELAAETIRKAIEDYLVRGKDPWRKMYQNR
jgi:nitrogen fixation NifU-like protein